MSEQRSTAEKGAPRSGDIAYYEACVPGGDPYRVTVVWRHSKPGTTGGGTPAWYNVAGTLHPVDVTGKTLHLLVRDGYVLSPAVCSGRGHGSHVPGLCEADEHPACNCLTDSDTSPTG